MGSGVRPAERGPAELCVRCGQLRGRCPHLTTSLRGPANVMVTVETLSARCIPACSAAPPRTLAALIHMLASMRDAHGNTTVPLDA